MKKISKYTAFAFAAAASLCTNTYSSPEESAPKKSFFERHKTPILMAGSVALTVVAMYYVLKPTPQMPTPQVPEEGFFSRAGNWLADHTHIVFGMGGMYHMGGSTPAPVFPRKSTKTSRPRPRRRMGRIGRR